MQRGAGHRAARAVVVEVRGVTALDDDGEHASAGGHEVEDLVSDLVARGVRVIDVQRPDSDGHLEGAIGLRPRFRVELELFRAGNQLIAGRVTVLHNPVG
jgi:hypothetical protein